jgi:hypothetical protein
MDAKDVVKIQKLYAKLSEKYSYKEIIEESQKVLEEQKDIEIWDRMSDADKTKWFLDFCKQHGLTISEKKMRDNNILISEFLDYSKKPYFMAWETRKEREYEPAIPWHIELGSSFHDDIWRAHPGLKGKEEQMKKIIELRKQST